MRMKNFVEFSSSYLLQIDIPYLSWKQKNLDDDEGEAADRREISRIIVFLKKSSSIKQYLHQLSIPFNYDRFLDGRFKVYFETSLWIFSKFSIKVFPFSSRLWKMRTRFHTWSSRHTSKVTFHSGASQSDEACSLDSLAFCMSLCALIIQ